MPRRDAQSCSQILEHAALPMLDRARKLQQLERAVLRQLPENLAAHCKVVNLNNETLILAAESSAWAARLRCGVPELLRRLQDELPFPLSKLHVKVQPVAGNSRPAPRPKPKLSMRSGTLLAHTADSVGDEALREALYRLAAKARDS